MCNHPKVIRLYGAFDDDNYIYLVTEYCEKGTLFEYLRKKKTLSEEETSQYMKEVIEALIYLHSQNPPILHRDLKPENILMTNDSLKIADFGWSSTHDSYRNTFCGTLDYISPEMIMGTGHNDKLDVWSTGVLMYELLHGKAPFTPQTHI